MTCGVCRTNGWPGADNHTVVICSSCFAVRCMNREGWYVVNGKVYCPPCWINGGEGDEVARAKWSIAS